MPEKLFPALIGRSKRTEAPASRLLALEFPALIGRSKSGGSFEQQMQLVKFPALIGRSKSDERISRLAAQSDVSSPDRKV